MPSPSEAIGVAGMVETAADRAVTYAFFARLLREAPGAALLQAMVEARALTRCARSPEPLEDARWPEQAETIAIEFATLFVVPGDGMIAPYESVYCDTLTIDASTACSAYFSSAGPSHTLTGYLGGSSASAVARAYAEAGLALDPAFHDLPDHLAVELEFMGCLLAQGRREAARTFFAEHLGRWVEKFLTRMEHQRISSLYAAVSRALRRFLMAEVADGGRAAGGRLALR